MRDPKLPFVVVSRLGVKCFKMQDKDHIMATLIDEGLVEDCLDEVITITDMEEFPIIDLDDIDVTIEDPGYVLEEPLNACKQTEEYTSSYKKGSFTLPVQFFDINSNVSLLKKCRPISIKIVDCNIYPWYYKRTKYQATENIEITKDEDKDKDMLKNALADFITFNCNDIKNEKSLSVNEPNTREIQLSLKQSLAISKLKDDIKETIRNYKMDQDYDFKGNTDENNAKHHDIITDGLLSKYEKNMNESLLNKNNDIINPNDLLKYEEIAQTIVRNLDYRGANCGNDEVVICNEKSKEKVISVNSYNEDVEMVSVLNIDDLGRKERNEKASENIITSPILPCTVRPKKTRKEMLTKTSTVPNTTFKMCNDPRNSCHKFVSADKVIPHYHYIIPNSTPNNTNNSFISTKILNNNNNCIDNYSMSQYNITRNTYYPYVTRPKHYVNNKKYPHSTEPPMYHPPSLETYPNCVGFTSGLDYNPIICNDPLLHNAPLRTTPSSVNKPHVLKKNVNPKAYIPYPTPQLNYVGKYLQQGSSCPEPVYPTITENLINVNNVSGVDFSKENYRLNSAPPFIPNSLHPRNEHVSIKTLQNPLQMTVAYVRKNHPILTNILDSNRSSIIKSTENNVKINTDTNQFSIGPSMSTPKASNKINLDALITVLAQDNCDTFNLKTNYTSSIKNNTKPKKVRKTMPEFATLNTHQNDAKYDNNGGPLKTLQPTQRDFEIIVTSEKIPRRVSNYSPPILPIPTIRKGLEILSKLQPYVPPNDTDYTTTKIYSNSDTNNSRREHNEITNMKRKRIANCDEKILVGKKSRKISLQEYKQRKLENGKEDNNIYVNSNDEHTTKMQNGETKMSYLGCGS